MICRFRFAFVLVLLSIFASAAYSAGEIEPTFSGSAYYGTNGTAYCVRKQPDGEILMGGNFTQVNGYATPSIVRLNIDGSVDQSFTPPAFYYTGGNGIPVVQAIAIQPDGKILIGGGITGYGGV